MEISPLLLARFQFSLSLNFHVLFAAMAMALGWLVCTFRYLAWRNPAAVWMDAYRFWVRVFALTFFMALASVIPLLLELGVLWPALLERAGNVLGPLIAIGITTLFIIKSIFLSVMFFGQRRVSARAHVLSVAMVALGLTATIFWGLVLVSWTHTPVGATLIDGRYLVTDWAELILNPSLVMLILQFVAGGFLIVGCLLLSVTAWQTRRRPLEHFEKVIYKTGLVLAIGAAALQIFALDGHLRFLARTQPITAAAVMGFWQTGSEPSLVWAGWPGTQEGAQDGLTISDLSAKRWLGQLPDGQWMGLDRAEQQPAALKSLFWLPRLAFYGLVCIIGLSLFAGWVIARRGGDPAKYPSRLLQAQIWLGYIAVAVWLCLWNLLEAERLPFLVANSLRQEDLLTAAPASLLAAGFMLSLAIYLVLLLGWLRMVVHAARFGVVPVRKPGVRP